MSTQTSAAPTGLGPAGSLWRNGDFLKLWTGETVSLVGTYVTQLALPLIALNELDANPGQVGSITALQFLPVLLGTVFVGRLVDRCRRRPLLITANLARAAALAVLPLSWWLDVLSVHTLYGVAFTLGVFSAVFDVAYLSYLPSLVDKRQLVSANSKLQGSYALAQVGGPGLGGLLIRLFGGPLTIVINVVSYLFSAVTLLLIRTREERPARPAEREDLRTSLLLGFAFLWRDTALRALTAKAAWFNLCEQALLIVFTVYAVRDLELSAGQLGLCIGLGSLGAVLGTLLARRLGRLCGVGGVLLGTMGISSAAPALILLANGAELPDLAVITLAFAVFSLGFTVYFVTLRQTAAPGHQLGRVNAAFRTIAFGTFPLGAWLGGTVAEHLGAHTALVGVCAAFAAGWLVFAAASTRALRPLAVSLD